MPRTLALALLFLAATAGDVVTQVTDDTLVPRGRIRLQFNPSFTSWDSRFGEQAERGTILHEEEALGSDLTDESGTSLFSTVADLENHLRALTGDDSYSGVLGDTRGLVSQDVTRIDVGAHVGIFDWLTVGVVVPLVKTHTSVDLAVRQDGVESDLGINPTVSSIASVFAFLDAVSGARAAAEAQSAAVCSADPSSTACTDAQSLASRVGSFHASSTGAYFSSAFFPTQGSAIAESLSETVAELDGDLTGAGLPGIGTAMRFATELLDVETLADVPTIEAFGIKGARLEGLNSLWAVGDVELSALGRVLDGEVSDSGSVEPRLRYTVAGGVLARLATGTVDAHDVFLDVGTGDGQLDIEGRVLGFLGLGARLGIHASLRYGVQQSVDLLRRVAPPELVMAPENTLRVVRWTPGSYLGVDVEPVWRLSPNLSVVTSYRLFSKGDDSYQILGAEPEGGEFVDATDLERESGVTVHSAGLGLRYSTVDLWRAGDAPRPLELHLRVRASIAGGGGQTPVASRVEFGVRLFRGMWGGD